MSAIDNIIEGATNAIGSGGIGLALGTIKGAIQSDQQKKDAKELADYQNKLARQNALDKWSIEKSAMMKAGINMAALGGMQTMNIPADVPTPQIENTQYVPPIAQGAQQIADADLKGTEEEKNKKFIENAKEYWQSVIAKNTEQAKKDASESVYKGIIGKRENLELDLKNSVVEAYGGTSAYGRRMYDQFLLEYDNMDASTKELCERAGLNAQKANEAYQNIIQSQEFIRIAWYNALVEQAYKEGIVAVENGKLQWSKELGSKQLQFEIDKFNKTYKLDLRKFEQQKWMDELTRKYQDELIKGKQIENAWLPVTLFSRAFRDVGVGFGGFAKGISSIGKMAMPLSLGK